MADSRVRLARTRRRLRGQAKGNKDTRVRNVVTLSKRAMVDLGECSVSAGGPDDGRSVPLFAPGSWKYQQHLTVLHGPPYPRLQPLAAAN